MSESSEIIRRLAASGVNYESIGQAVGRNRSLIRQVGIGAKPGNNLRDSLAALEARLAGAGGEAANRAARSAPVAAPARRTTSRGALAKVRRPTTIRGRAWTSSTVKQAGVRNGARGLGHPMADAAEAGQHLAATVTFSKRTKVEGLGSAGPKNKRGRAGFGGSVDLDLGPADEVWQSVREDFGGDVTEYILSECVGRGLVPNDAEIVGIDLRSYSA